MLRLTGALCPAAIVTLALWAATGQAGTQACIAAFFVTAALGFLAPQIGSFAAPVCTALVCIAAGHIPLGAALLVAAILWWVWVGRTQPLQTAGTFLSCLSPTMPVPIAPLVCGYLLPPGPAAASAALGCLTQACLAALAQNLPGIAFLLTAGAWTLACAAQSAIGHEGTKVRCYLSTLLATFIILAVQLGCARMENEGVWTSLPQGELACVLGSTILVALLILAFGSSAHLESDLEHTDAPATNVP